MTCRKRILSLFPLFVIAFLLPMRLNAWGRAGHETIAIIAQDLLSPLALQRVRSILGNDIGLDKIATCADDIKYRSVKCGQSFFLPLEPNTTGWHFIDIPTQDSPGPGSLDAYCKDNSCAHAQIKAQMKVLQDPQASMPEKQAALMFIVHLVGDEHQPLHCATEIDSRGYSDRGGNAKSVLFENKRMNLHALWDDLIEKGAVQPDSLAKTLEAGLRGKDISQWLQGDYIVGAVLESFSISKEIIYPNYHAHGPVLGPDYKNEMQPIVYRRLQMGGVRLAALLEKALGQ